MKKYTYSPIVKDTVEETLRLALSGAEYETQQQLLARRSFCLDFYQSEVLVEDGGKDEYLKNYFGQKDENGKWEYADKLLLEHVPLTEQLVDLKARNYRDQPERLVDGDVAEDYTDLLKRSGWFSMSKRVEQFTQLLGDIAVGVMVDEETDTLKFILVTEYYPLFAEDDPLGIDPIAIIYPTALRSKVNGVVYQYIDKDVKARLDREGRLITENGYPGEEPNEYGVFNFFFPHRKKPVHSHFGTPRIALALANQNIDVAKTSLNQLLHYNGYKQIVIIGETDGNETKFTMGAKHALVLKTGMADQTPPSVSALDMQADFAAHIEAIKFCIENAAQSLNMAFQWKVEGGPQSGRSLEIQNARDMEDRASQQEILDEYIEQPLYRIVSAINGKFKIKVEQGDLSVDFPEAETVTTVQEEISWREHQINTGQKSVVDFMIEDNPDLSEEEAAAKLENNMKLKRLLMGAQVEEKSILAILNDTDTASTLGLNQAPEQTTGGPGQGQGGGPEPISGMGAQMGKSGGGPKNAR